MAWTPRSMLIEESSDGFWRARADAECQKFVPLIQPRAWRRPRRGLGRRAWPDCAPRAARPAHAQCLPWHVGGVRVRQRGAAGSVRLLDRFATRPADLPWPAAVFLTTSLTPRTYSSTTGRLPSSGNIRRIPRAVLADKLLPQLVSHRSAGKFGHPHRNQALGREDTAAESALPASDDVRAGRGARCATSGGTTTSGVAISYHHATPSSSRWARGVGRRRQNFSRLAVAGKSWHSCVRWIRK